jgi:hypothetical protein
VADAGRMNSNEQHGHSTEIGLNRASRALAAIFCSIARKMPLALPKKIYKGANIKKISTVVDLEGFTAMYLAMPEKMSINEELARMNPCRIRYKASSRLS